MKQPVTPRLSNTHYRPSHGQRILLPLLVAGMAGSLLATDFQKANNNINLNLPSSYTPNSGTPGTSDRILINSVMTANQGAALGANLSIDGIFIDSTATKTLTISGSNSLTLGSSGILISSALSGSGLTFNGPAISLGAVQTWDLAARGLTINGGTTISDNGNALTISTTGGQIFFHNTTAMTLNAAINGSAALTLDSTPTPADLTLTNSSSAFTGGIAISTGSTVTATTMNTGGGASAVGTGQVQIKGGAFKYSGNTASSNQNVAIDSRFVSTVEVTTAGQTLTLSNFKNTNTTNPSLLANGANLGGAGNLTITNVIADSTQALRTALAVTKFGSGTMTLSAVNTFTGATTVSAGTLVLSGTGSINTTSGTSVAASATLTNNSSVAYNKSLTLAEGAVINGSGSFAPTSMTITADLTGGSFTTFALGSALLTKAGNLELTLTGITTGTYILFSGGTPSGAFSTMTIGGVSLASGGSGNFSGLAGSFNYAFTNTSNQLIVTVPEPATWSLLAGSLTLVLALRRRRA